MLVTTFGAALSVFLLVSRCYGQSLEFQWKFGNDLVATELSQCQNYSIIVESRSDNASAVGSPPYYLIAFVPGGVPTTSLIGTDPNNLTWQVNQPAGSKLLLSVVDSEKNNGGQPPTFFTSTAGNSSTCLPPAPTSDITITANVTGILSTCEPLGLRINGGQMPYIVTIAALDSPVITNVPLGPHDDVLTYINRADPNGQLLAAVSDATGQWGQTTSLISTTGNSNTTCVGLISTSGNSSFVDQHPIVSHRKDKTAIIAGIVAPATFFILLSIILLLWKNRQSSQLAHDSLLSSPYLATTPFYPKRSSMVNNNTISSKHMYLLSSNFREPSYSQHSLVLQNATSTPIAEVEAPSNPSNTLPLPPIPRRSSKRQTSRSNSEARPSTGGSSNTNPASEGLDVWRDGMEADIIIQHRDGGTVHELPPPYLHRVHITEGQPTFWAI